MIIIYGQNKAILVAIIYFNKCEKKRDIASPNWALFYSINKCIGVISIAEIP